MKEDYVARRTPRRGEEFDKYMTKLIRREFALDVEIFADDDVANVYAFVEDPKTLETRDSTHARLQKFESLRKDIRVELISKGYKHYKGVRYHYVR